MSGKRRYPHLKTGRAGSIAFAYKAIPVEVRHLFDGRKFFQTSTGKPYGAEAAAIAAQLVADWSDQIAAAKAQPSYVRPTGVAQKPAKQSEVDRQMTAGFHEQLIRENALLREKLRELTKAEQAATPFLRHFEAWKAAARYDGHALKTAISHIEGFAKAAVNPTIEGLCSEHVQLWVDTQTGDAENTIRNRLYGVKNYWKWMTQRGLAPRESKPFDGIEVKGREDDESKVRFDPADVPKLWTMAATIHLPLFHMVKIAAYSGARREAIGNIKVADVHLDDLVPNFVIRQDKTASGKRTVPIHTEIIDLMRDLVKNADHDGYLIHSTATGRLRTDPLGKRFSKMKTAMGFDSSYDFHSLRRTVIHLMETAEAPEGVCKDLVGHKKRSLTYGTYSGITTLQHRQEWLERAIRYPMR